MNALTDNYQSNTFISTRTANVSGMSDTYMCLQTKPSLAQTLACRLFDYKPIPEPALAYC